MALVAEIEVSLDLPFGSVDYAVLDEVIAAALRAHGIPVIDVEVGGLRPLDAPIDPGTLVTNPLSPFAQRTPGVLGPPGPFGTRV